MSWTIDINLWTLAVWVKNYPNCLINDLQVVGLDHVHGQLLAHVECAVLPPSMSLSHVVDLKCHFGRMQQEQSNHVILFLLIIHHGPHLLKANRWKRKSEWGVGLSLSKHLKILHLPCAIYYLWNMWLPLLYNELCMSLFCSKMVAFASLFDIYHCSVDW